VADLAEPLNCYANMHLSALRATTLLTQNCIYWYKSVNSVYVSPFTMYTPTECQLLITCDFFLWSSFVRWSLPDEQSEVVL